MEQKDRELFRSTWSLVEKHQKLLGDVLPVVNEIAVALGTNSQPSSEQLRTWIARYTEMNQRLYELTAAFEALIQDAGPLVRYDS